MRTVLGKSLAGRWDDPCGLMQVVIGPRQVGKTTAVLELIEGKSAIYASADLPTPPTPEFIVTHWEKARKLSAPKSRLVLDEVQKIPRWSETIKMLWDQDAREKNQTDVWILGSSAILLEKGLSESLTGRFELNFFPHWIYPECHEVFKASMDEYAKWGGYPKVYSLRNDEGRCADYVQNSIIETTLGRDILTLHAVDKPALLRQLFWYVSKLPCHIVSYEKILGHLQGKGNSATLVHYAELLEMAFIVQPLSKYSPKPHRIKRSRPKWLIPNPALVDAAVKKEGLIGFVLENLIGSHLANLIFGKKMFSLHYWREGDFEIDFILAENGSAVFGIEVKSGRSKRAPARSLLKKSGLNVPLIFIGLDNAESFLFTTDVQQVISFGGNSRGAPKSNE